tara:strand:- start:324 stop:509 length:186 start_codon:yes stop_codon:yes gene_type:complete
MKDNFDLQNENRFNPIGTAVILGVVWWTLVYFFGIFQVLIWSIVLAAMIGIAFKLYEDRMI